MCISKQCSIQQKTISGLVLRPVVGFKNLNHGISFIRASILPLGMHFLWNEDVPWRLSFAQAAKTCSFGSFRRWRWKARLRHFNWLGRILRFWKGLGSCHPITFLWCESLLTAACIRLVINLLLEFFHFQLHLQASLHIWLGVDLLFLKQNYVKLPFWKS